MQDPPSPIKIVVADDHSIYRKGLIAFLGIRHGIQICGEAADGIELIELVERVRPHIIITDIQMPRMDGIEAIALITKRFIHVGIIALSMHNEGELIRKILNAGAHGYLMKTSNEEEIYRAVNSVYRKENYYCGNTIAQFVSHITGKQEEVNSPSFTELELKVIGFICEQYCNKEIADKLHTSIRSIESARERIQIKTGAKNMAGIVIYAIQNKITSLSDVNCQIA